VPMVNMMIDECLPAFVAGDCSGCRATRSPAHKNPR